MSRRVLMIDDDPELIGAVGSYLKLKGLEFEGVTAPERAAARARAGRPDVILLDVQFPTGSGWNVCRDLKKDPALSGIPVIMISGRHGGPIDKAKGLEIGADDYLSKPFDVEVLLLKIEAILRTLERDG